MAYNSVPGASYTNEHVGQLILGVRKDNNAVSQVSGSNLYHPLLFDTAGNLRVGIQYQAGGGSTTIISSASNIITVSHTNAAISVGVTGGNLAVGVTGGNITIISASNLITVSCTNPSYVISSASNLISVLSAIYATSWSTTTNFSSAQTDKAIVTAPGGALSLYITDIVFSNGATEGTIKLVENTAASSDRYGPLYFAVDGGCAKRLATPVKLTANTNLGITSTLATTHTVFVAGYNA